MTNTSHQNDPGPVIMVALGPTAGNAPLTVASLGIRLHVISGDGDAWRDWAHRLAGCEAVLAECDPLLRPVLDRLAKTHDGQACRRSTLPSTE
ncbi:hypothetical protein [Microvirga sp. TS319]|uniref:hypothetical protein n=1 Tax=Microvirga sp. TS319 TaxID=3241165 RepID=UPI00351A8C7F